MCAMGTPGEVERVRSAVRGLMEADRLEGRLKPREHYGELFAGHGDLVAEGHRRAAVEASTRIAGSAGATVTSDRPPPPAPLPPPDAGLPEDVERVGPYVVLRELGRGGMGVVYLAEDPRVGRKVALKVLPSAFASSHHLLARFRREASIASRLDHPGICTVFEAGEEDGVAFMAMRYLEG